MWVDVQDLKTQGAFRAVNSIQTLGVLPRLCIPPQTYVRPESGQARGAHPPQGGCISVPGLQGQRQKTRPAGTKGAEEPLQGLIPSLPRPGAGRGGTGTTPSPQQTRTPFIQWKWRWGQPEDTNVFLHHSVNRCLFSTNYMPSQNKHPCLCGADG